jgi:hypothetical protein
MLHPLLVALRVTLQAQQVSAAACTPYKVWLSLACSVSVLGVYAFCVSHHLPVFVTLLRVGTSFSCQVPAIGW